VSVLQLVREKCLMKMGYKSPTNYLQSVLYKSTFTDVQAYVSK
jgi:hypothetical protein